MLTIIKKQHEKYAVRSVKVIGNSHAQPVAVSRLRLKSETYALIQRERVEEAQMETIT